MSLPKTDLINEKLLDLNVDYSSFTGSTLPKVISFRGGLNNKFCSDTDNGLKCNKDINDKEEQFIVEHLGGDFVALRSAKNYKYVSDTPDGLMSTADVVDTWERFKIEDIGNNQIALRGGRTGRYVTQLPDSNSLFSAGLFAPSLGNFIDKIVNQGKVLPESAMNMYKKESFSGKLVAEGTEIGQSQKFTVFPIASTNIPNKITIKNELGKFCYWNPNTNRIVCNQESNWVDLNVERIGGNLIALKAGNKYLSDQPDGIKANATKILNWEIFNYVDLGNGKFALKGGRNNKYCRDTANGLICDADSYNNGGVFSISSTPLRPRGGFASADVLNEDLTLLQQQKDKEQQDALQREQDLIESQKILGMPRKTAMIVGISLGVLLLGITTIIIVKKVKSKK